MYFVTVQKKSYLPGEAEAGYVTRISRTCDTDANFDTYSEVTLECRLGGDNYNLVQDAVTLPASKKLAEDLGVSEGDQVLVAVFAPGRDMTSRPREERAHVLQRPEAGPPLPQPQRLVPAVPATVCGGVQARHLPQRSLRPGGPVAGAAQQPLLPRLQLHQGR